MRGLFTLSVRDSRGHTTVVFRAFLPNEQAWIFRWLFQEAIPTILGELHLADFKAIFSDGNSQEIGQIDAAIPFAFPGAVH